MAKLDWQYEPPIYLIPIEDQEDQEYCCPDMKDHVDPDSKNKIIDYNRSKAEFMLRSHKEGNDAQKELNHCPWCSIDLKDFHQFIARKNEMKLNKM